MTNTGQLLSEDEKLRKETSRALIRFVLRRSASNDDIASGINKPKSRLASLINVDHLLARRKIQAAVVSQANNHINNGDDW